MTSAEPGAPTLRQVLLSLAGHAGVPLACGAAIYIGLGATALRGFGWLGNIGASDFVRAFRLALAPLRRHAPAWVVHGLPDGLWAYTTTAAALLIWRDDVLMAPPLRTFISHLGLIASCAVEALQLAGSIPGTADPRDLLFACGASIAATLAIAPHRRPHQRLSKGHCS